METWIIWDGDIYACWKSENALTVWHNWDFWWRKRSYVNQQVLQLYLNEGYIFNKKCIRNAHKSDANAEKDPFGAGLPRSVYSAEMEEMSVLTRTTISTSTSNTQATILSCLRHNNIIELISHTSPGHGCRVVLLELIAVGGAGCISTEESWLSGMRVWKWICQGILPA